MSAAGPASPSWRGDDVTYTAAHLRMSKLPHPDHCQTCGAHDSDRRYEWALRAEVDRASCKFSADGYAYTTRPADYIWLCKKCHNEMDVRKSVCKRGHALEGSNLYFQPGTTKRFCLACQSIRRAQRSARERARRITAGLPVKVMA